MNRLVLIGNGFDLAHGLKTSYADFIYWYFDKRAKEICCTYAQESSDKLFSVKYLGQGYLYTYFCYSQVLHKERGYGKEILQEIFENKNAFESKISPLFERILKGMESKTWAGIEQDYYDLLKEYAFRDPNINPVEPPIKALNQQLRYLQQLLVEYLTEVTQEKPTAIKSVKDAIYAPLRMEDMSIDGERQLNEHKKYWETRKNDYEIEEIISNYGLDYNENMQRIHWWKEAPKCNSYPEAFYLPNNILFLNFNYTDTVQLYITPRYQNQENHIHGNITNPASIIFGYGDELDDKFKELKAHKNNACLSHVKSIRYLEAPNYRRMLSFIESEPFQVLIMGHSCGNSDRTLLNTIFEHKNCISIKPYFYQKEDGSNNYIELIQNISRNFNDMKLMRDRVVNKTQCEPLPQIKKQD